MTPSFKAYVAARARVMTAIESLTPGCLTYDGQEYQCAVSLEGESYEMSDLGQKLSQRLRACIPKARLPGEPVRGKMVLYEGRAYEIELVSGHHAELPDWEITAFRVPGADT